MLVMPTVFIKENKSLSSVLSCAVSSQSLVSLKTLNYFKTSLMILNKLGSFYLVSLWHVLMFASRGLSRN